MQVQLSKYTITQFESNIFKIIMLKTTIRALSCNNLLFVFYTFVLTAQPSLTYSVYTYTFARASYMKKKKKKLTVNIQTIHLLLSLL